MEANTKSTALLLAVLMLTVPLASADLHDEREPTITDETGEGDPRTGGATSLPPSLDIVQANISPSPTSVSFTIEVQSLLVPHSFHPFTGDPQDEVHYEVRFALGDDHQDQLEGTRCEDATHVRVLTRTSYGAYITGTPFDAQHPSTDTMSSRVRCMTPGSSNPLSWSSSNYDGIEAWADRSENTITISVDRVLDDQDLPFLQPDTNLTHTEAMVHLPGTVFGYVEDAYELDQTPPPYDYYDYAGPGTNETI